MEKTYTPEEVKQKMIDRMGTDFGLLFYSLNNELLWLTKRWIEFRELYGTKETRIDLLNSSAPFFFYTIQNVLWENLLLGIARITDPQKSRVKKEEKKNITFKAIPSFIEDPAFKNEIADLIKELETETEFCRDWRNRWIAHMDYELSTDKKNAKPLEEATRAKYRTALERVHEIYNKISLKYLGSEKPFKFMKNDGGAISLLNTIELGLRFEQERKEKRMNGDFSRDDFQSKI